MSLQDLWDKALRKTEIVRPRVQPLLSNEATRLPYICLSESSSGGTVVRKGHIVVERPSLILPYALPQFQGFDFEKDLQFSENALTNFLIVRGITFPSMKYDNVTASVEASPEPLSRSIEDQKALLQRQENVHSGLIVGPGDCWQLSVLIFVASQVMRQAEGDVRRLLDDHWKNQSLN